MIQALSASILSGVIDSFGAQRFTMVDSTAPTASGSRQASACMKSTVTFLKDSMRIVVKQPPHEPQKGPLACPPQHFDVHMAGSVSSPETTVTIGQPLLPQLPLLSSIRLNCTASDADGVTDSLADTKIDADVKSTEIELPGSVWGLVSSLVLLERSVSPGQWFVGRNACSDATLPVQTLEVGYFSTIE